MASCIIQGNTEFVGEDQAEVSEEGDTSIIASLLGVVKENVDKALCSRIIAAGGAVVDKHLNVAEAHYARKAFAKVGCN